MSNFAYKMENLYSKETKLRNINLFDIIKYNLMKISHSTGTSIFLPFFHVELVENFALTEISDKRKLYFGEDIEFLSGVIGGFMILLDMRCMT